MVNLFFCSNTWMCIFTSMTLWRTYLSETCHWNSLRPTTKAWLGGEGPRRPVLSSRGRPNPPSASATPDPTRAQAILLSRRPPRCIRHSALLTPANHSFVSWGNDNGQQVRLLFSMSRIRAVGANRMRMSLRCTCRWCLSLQSRKSSTRIRLRPLSSSSTSLIS